MITLAQAQFVASTDELSVMHAQGDVMSAIVFSVGSCAQKKMTATATIVNKAIILHSENSGIDGDGLGVKLGLLLGGCDCI